MTSFLIFIGFKESYIHKNIISRTLSKILHASLNYLYSMFYLSVVIYFDTPLIF